MQTEPQWSFQDLDRVISPYGISVSKMPKPLGMGLVWAWFLAAHVPEILDRWEPTLEGLPAFPKEAIGLLQWQSIAKLDTSVAVFDWYQQRSWDIAKEVGKLETQGNTEVLQQLRGTSEVSLDVGKLASVQWEELRNAIDGAKSLEEKLELLNQRWPALQANTMAWFEQLEKLPEAEKIEGLSKTYMLSAILKQLEWFQEWPRNMVQQHTEKQYNTQNQLPYLNNHQMLQCVHYAEKGRALSETAQKLLRALEQEKKELLVRENQKKNPWGSASFYYFLGTESQTCQRFKVNNPWEDTRFLTTCLSRKCLWLESEEQLPESLVSIMRQLKTFAQPKGRTQNPEELDSQECACVAYSSLTESSEHKVLQELLQIKPTQGVLQLQAQIQAKRIANLWGGETASLQSSSTAESIDWWQMVRVYKTAQMAYSGWQFVGSLASSQNNPTNALEWPLGIALMFAHEQIKSKNQEQDPQQTRWMQEVEEAVWKQWEILPERQKKVVRKQLLRWARTDHVVVELDIAMTETEKPNLPYPLKVQNRIRIARREKGVHWFAQAFLELKSPKGIDWALSQGQQFKSVLELERDGYTDLGIAWTEQKQLSKEINAVNVRQRKSSPQVETPKPKRL